MRLLLLNKASEFTSDILELRQIYIIFVRSVIEQSAVVWNSSLTQENAYDLERVQKNALKIILKENFITYEDALQKLKLQSLQERRDMLCENNPVSTLTVWVEADQ